MAGPAAHGELTASGRASAPRQPQRADPGFARYALAAPSDDAAIRRLLRDHPTRGAISLSFEREPDYFRSAALAGAEDQTIVAYEGGRLLCMGRCTTRPCWLGGQIRRVSYLAELRLDASAQGRVDLLRNGYRFFHALQQPHPPDFTFTSIAADNTRARRLLERGLRGLPRYTFLTDFTTLVVPTKLDRATLDEYCDQAPTARELADFLQHEQRHAHLAATWTTEQLTHLAADGLPLDRIHVARHDGKIVACAGFWDQRAFRQTVIRDYHPALRRARPLYNLAAAVIGSPRLPAPNSVLSHAFVSPFAMTTGYEHLLPTLLGSLRHAAARAGIQYLTFGFAANDPWAAFVRSRLSPRVYASRLYRITWPDAPEFTLPSLPFRPDIAFL